MDKQLIVDTIRDTMLILVAGFSGAFLGAYIPVSENADWSTSVVIITVFILGATYVINRASRQKGENSSK